MLLFLVLSPCGIIGKQPNGCVCLGVYNGKEPYPDRAVLHLSDLFEKIDIPGLPEKTLLELEVQVININEGCNEEITRKCKELYGYSAFTAKVREYKHETGNLKTALKESFGL